MTTTSPLDAKIREYADGLFAKTSEDLQAGRDLSGLQRQLGARGQESVYHSRIAERTIEYIDKLGQARLASFYEAYEVAQKSIDHAIADSLAEEVRKTQEIALAARLSSMKAESENLKVRTGLESAASLKQAVEAELRRGVAQSTSRIRREIYLKADRNALKVLASPPLDSPKPWWRSIGEHVGETIAVALLLTFAFAFVKVPVLAPFPSWLVFFGLVAIAVAVLEVIKRPSKVVGVRRFAAPVSFIGGVLLLLFAVFIAAVKPRASTPSPITQSNAAGTRPMDKSRETREEATKKTDRDNQGPMTAVPSPPRTLGKRSEHSQPNPQNSVSSVPTGAAREPSVTTEEDKPGPLRADMERYHVPTLREFIRDMKAEEMWLSNVFERGHDGRPIGPLVDYPAALRQLESKGEIQILGTLAHRYESYSGTEQMDYKFKVLKLAEHVAPVL